MPPSILVTKLYAPVKKNRSVSRLRLLERLEAGAAQRLTLLSASAGSGKSTLLAEWIPWSRRRVAWLTLDEELAEPSTFLRYVISSLQTLVAGVGAGILEGLASPFPPALPAALGALINELVGAPEPVVLVLDDYHRLDSPVVDQLVTYLVENLPPRMHLVVGTREDPALPLSRWRARGELTELRVSDLQFTTDEAQAYFRDQGLGLPPPLVAELLTRTEGWAAGLQMAALSLAGSDDPGGFIRSFAGSHRFVLDYLIEEVLKTQSARVQEFLLATSVLDRFCGPLCDSVLEREDSQEALAALEVANLFIIPLDAERKWYRYHQLFSEMLRQRLERGRSRALIHSRASAWFEAAGLGPEAFRHAAAAQDVARVEGILAGGMIPTGDQGTVAEILRWLGQLPAGVLQERPLLLLRKGTMLLAAGQTTGVEEALAAAEVGFHGKPTDDRQEFLGQVATARSTLAVTQYRPQVIVLQAQKALELLRDDSLTYRFLALCGLGFAHLLLGNRVEAAATYQRALDLGRRTGDGFSLAMAVTSLGQVRELQGHLREAAEDYRSVLALLGPHPQPYACEASLGLARILYQWNDLDAAEALGRQGLELGNQYDPTIDRFVLCELFLARVRLARGDAAGALELLARTAVALQERGFAHRWPELAALQVEVLLFQGKVSAAAALADQHELAVGKIRVGLARHDPEVVPLVVALRLEKQARNWADETLQALVLEALVQHRVGDPEAALGALRRSLILAEPAGLLRLYLDEGTPMRELLTLAVRSVPSDYLGRLLTAFGVASSPEASAPGALSAREREVLGLIALGLTNEAIGAKLFLALDTVKGHNRRIFEKLQVSRRTQAVAKGRELGLF